MKKLMTLVCSVLVFAACGNEMEKKANEKLAIAQSAFDRGDYAEAKIQIDSIKVLYPKAFEARKASQELLMQVETKAQEANLLRLDNAMQVNKKEFESIKDKYQLEKDAEYQQVGNYLWPTQTIEKNMHRSFLRFQVSEQGVMTMTSIYCGAGNIHHSAIRVSTPDKSFAETPPSKDSYETTDQGENIEKSDYKLGEDGKVIEFISRNQDKNIRVEFIGDKKYVTTMSPTDKQAALEVYRLAQILSTMEQIKKEQEAANLKIGFIKKKKEVESSKNTKE